MRGGGVGEVGEEELAGRGGEGRVGGRGEVSAGKEQRGRERLETREAKRGGKKERRKQAGTRQHTRPRSPPAPRVPRLSDLGPEGLLDRPAYGPDAVRRPRAAARLLGGARLRD